MEFEVHGSDQCLVGIAAPDVDVDEYLGEAKGGYGLFAKEGDLKVDGSWTGKNGLSSFKSGDRVGVHLDMSRRTLQFSINGTMMHRIVNGIPLRVHYAVGGASGGDVSIATAPPLVTTPTASARSEEEDIADSMPVFESGDLVRLVDGLPGSTVLISSRNTYNALASLNCLGAASLGRLGTQLTCFTGTKVQISPPSDAWAP
jgi:hypothetical protein